MVRGGYYQNGGAFSICFAIIWAMAAFFKGLTATLQQTIKNGRRDQQLRLAEEEAAASTDWFCNEWYSGAGTPCIKH